MLLWFPYLCPLLLALPSATETRQWIEAPVALHSDRLEAELLSKPESRVGRLYLYVQPHLMLLFCFTATNPPKYQHSTSVCSLNTSSRGFHTPVPSAGCPFFLECPTHPNLLAQFWPHSLCDTSSAPFSSELLLQCSHASISTLMIFSSCFGSLFLLDCKILCRKKSILVTSVSPGPNPVPGIGRCLNTVERMKCLKESKLSKKVK